MYHYADIDGFVARGPGVKTWRAMRLALDGRVSREFVAHGHTTEPLALADELDGVPADSPLDRLRRAALAAREVLVMTDGTGVEQRWLERRRRRA